MATPISIAADTARISFKTANQSMWTSGTALAINDSWTLFSQSLSNSYTAFGGDLTASFDLMAGLFLDVQGTTGGVSLDYPVNIAMSRPSAVGAGQQFSLQAVNNGLASGAPHFSAVFPEFSIDLKAKYKADFSVSFNSDWVGPYTVASNHDKTYHLLSLHSGDHKKLADGFELFLPKDYDPHARSETTAAGAGGETVSLDVETPDVATVTIDLISLLQDVIGPEFPDLSGSFDDGDFSYDLLDLSLKAGVNIAQQFTFVPTSIEVDITAPWGARTTVPLGTNATFQMPKNWGGAATLSVVHVINGNLVSQTGFSGNASLTVTALSGGVDLLGYSNSFGPLYNETFDIYNGSPVYVVNPGGPDGFALDGFNSPERRVEIQRGSGALVAPGGVMIDASAFSANEAALMQGVLNNLAAFVGAGATNLRNNPAGTGSLAPLGGQLNVQLFAGTATALLDEGFSVGILDSSGGGGSLTGRGSGLLAAAAGAGKTATLNAYGNETLVAGQAGNVTFNISQTFTGTIAGLESGDAINIQGMVGTAANLVGTQLVVSLDGFPSPFAVTLAGDLTGLEFQVTSMGQDGVFSVRVTGSDTVVLGHTTVYLEGGRAETRSEETNLGNFAADSGVHAAQRALGSAAWHPVGLLPPHTLRGQIGDFDDDGRKIAKAGNSDTGTASGGITQRDVETAFRAEKLMVFSTTPEGLRAILEAAVAAGPDAGRFLQVGGLRYSYDPSYPPGLRITNIAVLDENGAVVGRLLEGGAVSVRAPAEITVLTTSTAANGDQGLPIKQHGHDFRFLLDGGGVGPTIAETRDFTDPDVVPAAALDLQEAVKAYLAARHNAPGAALNLADTPRNADMRIQDLSLRGDLVFQGVANQSGTPGDDVMTASAGDDTITAGAGNDLVSGGTGADLIDLGPGADRVIGSLDDMNGDVILGFGAGDRLEIQGFTAVPSQVAISQSAQGATIGIGGATIRFAGDYSSGSFLTTTTGSGAQAETIVTFRPAGGTAPAGSQEALLNQFLTSTGQGIFSVTLVSANTNHASQLGAYLIAPDGTIGDLQMVFQNVPNASNMPVLLGQPPPGYQFGFFLLPEGFVSYSSLPRDLSFTGGPGWLANVSNPEPPVLTSASQGALSRTPVIHAHSSLNPDDANQVVAGILPGGTQMLISFEDQLSPDGRGDFQDLVILVSAATNEVHLLGG
jgi:hypothetical protein